MKVMTNKVHLFFLFVIVSVSGLAFGQTNNGKSELKQEISEEARIYLQKALDAMEKGSIKRRQIEWKSFKERVFEKAAGAVKPTDTYPAIRFAIRELNDGHSFLFVPKPKNSPVENQNNSKSNKTSDGWTIASSPSDMQGQLIDKKIGYLLLPSFGGEESWKPEVMEEFAMKFQNILKQLENKGATKWILDLRYNSGGNMWAMLAGVGPLLGEQPIGYFNSETDKVPWTYQKGIAGTPNNPACQLKSPLILKRPFAPVAVLIGKYTTSAGEAIAVAFQGRGKTKFFGSPSGGATTATQTVWLGDGAILFLTVAVYADRNQKEYGGKILPDLTIDNNPTELGTPLAKDPTVNTAQKWLKNIK
jgi:hypothetical protein